MPEFVRVTPSGQRQFVRSQSFSHHQHHSRPHYRPRCPDNCACVTIEQWDNLCDQNRNFLSVNETLTRENRTLKSDLQALNQEVHRLRVFNQQIIDEVQELKRHPTDEDNVGRYRRRVAELKTEVSGKDHDIRRLEKENGNFKIRVRTLTETVTGKDREIEKLTSLCHDWKRDSNHWKERSAEFERRYVKSKRALFTCTTNLRDAMALVEELRHTIRHIHDPLPPLRHRHRYEFG
ncbi:Uu.00g069290.m01.CDS01 [Anthostomella pinea]|uniref:Uu.00g069290.m01.CDS01 n=1 Tax=Anthostomella pinea TaxID=933095 RepID=A0AAI8VUI0_9PEZI|nr:Uu.00g069290.m01.CDS01 [Anthostomella pinea]